MKSQGATQTYFQTVVFQKHAANLLDTNKLVHIHPDVKNILSCFVWECHPLSFSDFQFLEDAGLPFTVPTLKTALLIFVNLYLDSVLNLTHLSVWSKDFLLSLLRGKKDCML